MITQEDKNPLNALRQFAMQFPETVAGTVCNKVSFKARGKAFLFLGVGDATYNVMLKLRDSLPAAMKLAGKKPDCYQIGSHGWVTLVFSHDQSPPGPLLENWIDESYRLLAPKQLVAILPERGQPAPAKTKKAPRKKRTASR